MVIALIVLACSKSRRRQARPDAPVRRVRSGSTACCCSGYRPSRQLNEGGDAAIGDPGKPLDQHLVVIDFVVTSGNRLIDARQCKGPVEVDCPVFRSVEHVIYFRRRHCRRRWHANSVMSKVDASEPPLSRGRTHRYDNRTGKMAGRDSDAARSQAGLNRPLEACAAIEVNSRCRWRLIPGGTMAAILALAENSASTEHLSCPTQPGQPCVAPAVSRLGSTCHRHWVRVTPLSIIRLDYRAGAVAALPGRLHNR